MTTQPETMGLQRRDYLLLAGFCLILFGLSMFAGRPLSIHESVLPQTAREMYADHDWVIPKRGGAPWLESPPLPQWVTVSVATLFGHCDSIWVVRLAPALMATAITLMVAWMGSVFFGRNLGLLSGFIMATTCQFTRYAWLAEDEIYLCGLVTLAVALFVRLEFATSRDDEQLAEQGFIKSFFSGRRWDVLVFFIALGMTNLAKGLIFGTAMAMIPIGSFLLWNADLTRIRRYLWFWGWLAFAAVMFAWPLASYFRYPDVVDVWVFDLGGRLDGSYKANTEPWWYYPVNLLWILAPWTLVLPIGMWGMRQNVFGKRFSAERFLWCWAILVPLVFSFASGKHHHYLLHAIAPWAIMASLGLAKIRERMMAWPKSMHNPYWSLLTTATPIMIAIWLLRAHIPGGRNVVWGLLIVCPFLTLYLSWAVVHLSAPRAAASLFLTLACGYGFGHWLAGEYVDVHRHDAKFLAEVRDYTADGKPVLIDLEVEPLRSFMLLFYLDDNTVPLHNLSFARDDRISDSKVYVLTQAAKQPDLEKLGDITPVMQSPQTGRRHNEADRLTLYELKYHESTRGVTAEGVRISPMQAMYRAEGPVLR